MPMLMFCIQELPSFCLRRTRNTETPEIWRSDCRERPAPGPGGAAECPVVHSSVISKDIFPYLICCAIVLPLSPHSIVYVFQAPLTSLLPIFWVHFSSPGTGGHRAFPAGT